MEVSENVVSENIVVPVLDQVNSDYVLVSENQISENSISENVVSGNVIQQSVSTNTSTYFYTTEMIVSDNSALLVSHMQTLENNQIILIAIILMIWAKSMAKKITERMTWKQKKGN